MKNSIDMIGLEAEVIALRAAVRALLASQGHGKLPEIRQSAQDELQSDLRNYQLQNGQQQLEISARKELDQILS